MEEVHFGGCLCGAVRYSVRGQPRRTYLCHCTFCQKLTGSAFLIEPVFPKENVALIGTPPRTYEHCSDSSGKTVYLHFCEKCGTTVGLTFERFPSMHGITGGTFDNPNWFKIDAYIFTRSAQRDMMFPRGALIYEAHIMTANGQTVDPIIYDGPMINSLPGSSREPA